MDSFGNHIKEARIIKYLSKSELARRVGITPQYITDIETDRVIPNEKKIEKLIEILDLNEIDTFKKADKIPIKIYEQAKRDYYKQ